MVDPGRLRALLDRLRDTQADLRRLRELGREQVREDVDRLNSVKYLFIVAARWPSTRVSTSSPRRV